MADAGAELLARSEADLRAGLIRAIAHVRAARPGEELALDLARGRLSAAAYATSGDLDRGLRAHVLPALLTAFIRGGDSVAAEVRDGAFAFDPMTAAAEYNELANRTVMTIVGDQDQALDVAARTAMSGGPAAGAAAMRVAIGMTPARVVYLDSYRRSLRSVEPALTPAKQREVIETYAQTLLGQRVDGLGLMLAQRAINLGQDQAVVQARRTGLVGDDDAYWEWITRDDSHVRPSHRPMHGQRRRGGEPFQSGAGVPLEYPHDPSAPLSETAGCRCGRRLLR